MIPILYDKEEMAFVSNGLGRLYDINSCIVTEERNGVYECDFEYPVTGKNFDKIIPGRIIACEHDYSNDVQPFDIVSYDKPINGIVKFHAVHISYRQSAITTSGTNVNSIASAFTILKQGQPSNPFDYSAEESGAQGYLATADGVPRSVKQILGGIEGSILDVWGGEYEFDKFNVKLWKQRGELRPFTIRYGVNMLDYDEQGDFSGTFTSCVPYWIGDNGSGGQVVVKGNRVDSGFYSYNERNDCVPLDCTDKFETRPTSAQLESFAYSYMNSRNVNLPSRSISVDFVRLQDTGEYSEYRSLLNCGLCDTIQMIFPKYGVEGTFKIVKTVYNVLLERYDNVELGNLSTSLAEALGVSSGGTFTETSGGGGGGGALPGMIEMYGGATAPSGWLLCDGTAKSRTQFAKLFAVIGTTFGAGDGTTTFNLPDLRNNFPVGAGSTYGVNSKGGTTTHQHTTGDHVLKVSEIPAHAHSFSYAQYNRSSAAPSATASALQYTGATKTTDNTGGGGAHNHGNTGYGNNLPPYIGLNFIICTGE